jgi:hypothetical protein
LATDKFPKLKEGTAKFPERGILSFIANGVIPNFSPVILVAPPAGETLPRVATTTTQNDPAVVGIVVGGSGDVAAGNAADAAGDAVDVVPIGSGAITKCVVDGALTAIAIGDLLVTDATAGQGAEKAVLPGTYAAADNERYTFAKALQPSTVDGDTILVILMGGGP